MRLSLIPKRKWRRPAEDSAALTAPKKTDARSVSYCNCDTCQQWIGAIRVDVGKTDLHPRFQTTLSPTVNMAWSSNLFGQSREPLYTLQPFSSILNTSVYGCHHLLSLCYKCSTNKRWPKRLSNARLGISAIAKSIPCFTQPCFYSIMPYNIRQNPNFRPIVSTRKQFLFIQMNHNLNWLLP